MRGLSPHLLLPLCLSWLVHLRLKVGPEAQCKMPKAVKTPVLVVHLWKSITAVRLGKAEYLIMASVSDMHLNSLLLQIRPNCFLVV